MFTFTLAYAEQKITDNQAIEIAHEYLLNENIKTEDWFKRNLDADVEFVSSLNLWSILFSVDPTTGIRGEHIIIIYLTPEGEITSVSSGH